MLIEDDKIKSTLRDIQLFSELSIEQLRKISSFSKIKRFTKNEIIFNENNAYVGFYVLLKGTVKVYKISSKGKESVVHIIKPLTAFADIPLFEGGNYPVSAEALEESLALLIPKEQFLELIHNEPEISLKMLAGFAKRLKSLINQLEDISSNEVPNRLAKYLLSEVKISGTENLPEPFIKLSVPKSTVASYIGTITETLSRALKKLQNEKIIRVSGKKIFITDLKKLKNLAN
ncbi:MAG TPA: Crp/Fnr family transcriptional regulator [Ignavibacteriaceae bacterium]|nr:Crp/Fnr family transcriptional regulator [Ignavibacteriaceae bacterium]